MIIFWVTSLDYETFFFLSSSYFPVVSVRRLKKKEVDGKVKESCREVVFSPSTKTVVFVYLGVGL